MTEPCDVTVGGATWLDQAQETAAQEPIKMQVHTGGSWGNRELHQSVRGAGSILDRRGNRQPQIHTGRVAGSEHCPPIARISTKVQRGRGDAGRGMGLQRGRAKAKTTAITKFRGICNLVILIIIYLNGQSTNIKRLNTTEI